MKQCNSFVVLILSAAALGLFAPGAATGQGPEPLTAWPYFKEIRPRGGAPPGGLFDFVLDEAALDQARTDHADLRLYDAAGREIPYALRVRREVETSDAFKAREFNRGAEGGAAQASYDLGERPQEHNEVEIETSGENFRRLVDVQGSHDGAQWSTLASQAIIFRFTSSGKTAEQRAVPYPVSRYRYLRVRVSRDAQVDRAAPEIKQVSVRRSVHVRAEILSFPAWLEGREATRAGGRPASAWRLRLGGRLPFHQLVLTVGGEPFSRPYRLEAIDDPANPVFVSSGDLVRREDMGATQPSIEFAERFARHLKLTVTDDRNPPLPITALAVRSAARQVAFEARSAGTGPLRLYYGNQKALAPRYDIAARLPAEFTSLRLSLGPERPNPTYRPEPRPLTERSPWLVYVVLAAASAALAAMLLNLARTAKTAAG